MACGSTRAKLEAQFMEAAQNRDLAKVAELIKTGVNPNCHYKDRVTALHVAAERGDISLAEILLSSKKLNLNCFTSHGYPPLIIACNSKQADFVNYLLDNGASVDITERFGKTSLHHIVMIDSLVLAKILIDHGATVDVMDTFNHTPLSEAVLERHCLPMVKLLIEHGADVNFYRGSLVMHVYLEACLGCHTKNEEDIVEYLLERGVNPNEIHPATGRNALHFIALGGYLPIARKLSEWGVRADRRDQYKLRPGDLALVHDNIQMHNFLNDLFIRQQQDDDYHQLKSYLSGTLNNKID